MERKLPPIGTLALHRLLRVPFFAMQNDRSLSSENFSLVLQQVMVVGVIAIGQTSSS
jgi:fructose transport system permease protein